MGGSVNLLRNPWTYRALYIVGTAILLGTELTAIFNSISGDTITENTRNFIGIAPFFWYTTLGFWAGLSIWLTRHFWWRKH